MSTTVQTHHQIGDRVRYTWHNAAQDLRGVVGTVVTKQATRNVYTVRLDDGTEIVHAGSAFTQTAEEITNEISWHGSAQPLD